MPTRSVRSRDLTPAQHAFIRQQIFLIPVYIWVIYAWAIFLLHLPVGPYANRTYVGRDFVHFYAQGVITRERDAHALYDIDAMAAVVERVVPVPIEARFPPVYGPQVGLFFSPIALLPYVQAMMLWLGLTIVGYGLCVRLVWRTMPSLRNRQWLTTMLALGAPGLHFTLSFAQVSVIGLVCFTALWLALRRGQLFLAGLAVGALAYKPQLGVVAAFVFVFGLEWRVVWGALTAVAVQLAASWAYWGSSIFLGYLGALRKLPTVIDAMEPDKQLMHSWRSLLLQAGLSAQAALLVSVVLSLATILVAVICWRTKGPVGPRYVILVLATLLVDPHIFSYDLLVLVPALLVAWDWANGQGAATLHIPLPRWTQARGLAISVTGLFAGLTTFVYAAPLLTIALPAIPVQWSVVGFLLLGGLLPWRLR